MTNIEFARFEPPAYPRTEVVTWSVPNGSSALDTVLTKKATELANEKLAENEVILATGRPMGNTKMKTDVNGREVDPVAERVTVWSCDFTIGLKEDAPTDA